MNNAPVSTNESYVPIGAFKVLLRMWV